MSASPHLSVVIASYNASETLGACLRSLQNQTWPEFEVIVVDSSSDGTDRQVQEFPQVRLLQAERRLYPGDARNRGIAQARGELIALLDADCQVEPDWAQRLLTAHEQRPEPVIATAIAPDPGSDRVAWAAWFCKCTRWAPESPAGPMSDLPACSMSFQRRVFEECGPFLEGTYCSDTAFCWAVRDRGYGLWFEPSIRVSHRYSPSLGGFLSRQLWHGRTFARVRRACRRVPRWRGLLLSLGWPALGLLLFARILRAVARHHIKPGRFLRCSPIVAAGLLAWAAGEGCGYLE